MNEQRRVETFEEFKLRIAAIIGGRSDDNDARAFLLSNTAEERAELEARHFDKLGTMKNIHRWGFFSIAIGIALLISGVSPKPLTNPNGMQRSMGKPNTAY